MVPDWRVGDEIGGGCFLVVSFRSWTKTLRENFGTKELGLGGGSNRVVASPTVLRSHGAL